jgi:hypothetical protein
MSGGIIWWSLVLIAFLVLGFYAVAKVKQWAKRPDDESATGFSLGDLRALHKAGKLSTEEFEKAKALIVEAAKRADQRKTEEAQEAKKRAAADILRKIDPKTGL